MPNRVRWWVTVDEDTKTKFEEYVIATHGNTALMGYELQRAINTYLGSTVHDMQPGDRIDKRTLEKLKLISDALKVLPKDQKVGPKVLETRIRDVLPGVTGRTLVRYSELVRKHAKIKKNAEGYIDYDLNEFHRMVERAMAAA